MRAPAVEAAWQTTCPGGTYPDPVHGKCLAHGPQIAAISAVSEPSKPSRACIIGAEVCDGSCAACTAVLASALQPRPRHRKDVMRALLFL